VPADALTARSPSARRQFSDFGWSMPREFIRGASIDQVRRSAGNADLGQSEKDVGKAIRKAAERVAAGEFDAHFPTRLFQTGSGTS